jgi:hypothetical protein
MILNGKALQLFSEWIDLNQIDSNDCVFLNALIIEWLDSVRVYVFVNRAFAFEEWNFEILGHFTSGFKYESRQEATSEAIKKANELINQTL